MIQLSPRVGRLVNFVLRHAPRTRLVWPEYGRIGLDPHGCTVFCTAHRGRRVELAFFEH